jgi:hypothetical protein
MARWAAPVVIAAALAGGLAAGVIGAGPRDRGGEQAAPAADDWTVDADADYLPDFVDNCDTVGTLSQADADGDGIGDPCEPLQDGDGDGVADDADNCAEERNSSQNDGDGDGIGSACDRRVGPPPGEGADAAATPPAT